MRQALSSFFYFSILTLLPAALAVLLPNIWWGVVLKVVLGFWLLGCVMNLLSGASVFHGTGPGFIINIPLFMAVVGLDRSWLLFLLTVLFLLNSSAIILISYQRNVETQAPRPDE